MLFLWSVQSWLQSEMFLSNSVDMMKNLPKGLVQLGSSLYSGWGFLTSPWDRQVKCLTNAWFRFQQVFWFFFLWSPLWNEENKSCLNELKFFEVFLEILNQAFAENFTCLSHGEVRNPHPLYKPWNQVEPFCHYRSKIILLSRFSRMRRLGFHKFEHKKILSFSQFWL